VGQVADDADDRDYKVPFKFTGKINKLTLAGGRSWHRRASRCCRRLTVRLKTQDEDRRIRK